MIFRRLFPTSTPRFPFSVNTGVEFHFLRRKKRGIDLIRLINKKEYNIETWVSNLIHASENASFTLGMKGVATIEILRRASTKRVAIIVAQDI